MGALKTLRSAKALARYEAARKKEKRKKKRASPPSLYQQRAVTVFGLLPQHGVSSSAKTYKLQVGIDIHTSCRCTKKKRM